MNRIPVITPGSVKGFMTARAPMALPQGYLSAIYDGRLNSGVPEVRPGSLTVCPAVNGAEVYHGSAEYNQNGTASIFVATYNSGTGKVSIARSTNGGTSFTVISPSAGTYGDTRFTGDLPIYFSIVSQSGTDYVIMQNGVDNVRVYDGTTMSVQAPASSAANRLQINAFNPGFGKRYWFSNTPTITNSTFANMNGTIQTATNGDKYLRILVNASVTSADTVVVSGVVDSIAGAAFTIPATVNAQQLFAWLVDEPAQLWRSLKIEGAVTSAGPWTTIYDPTDPATYPLEAVSTTGTAYLAGTPSLLAFSGTTLGALRFSYTGTAPGAPVTINLYIMAACGQEAPGTSYAFALGSNVSQSQYSYTIVTPVGPGDLPRAGIAVPFSEFFGWEMDFRISVFTASNGAYNRVYVYRQDLGTTGYYYITDFAALISPLFNNFKDGYDNVYTADFSRPLNPAGSVNIPIGTCMANINDRLFVGSGNRLWFSAASQPFLFSQSVNFDGATPISTSSGSFKKDGEVWMAIVAAGQVLTGAESLGTPQSGSISVYPITDHTCYVISGFDALSLTKSTPICDGTLSPFSPSTSSGFFYYLDNKFQIRKVDGNNSEALSKYTVDDQLRAIPNSRLKWVSGQVIDGRYYLAYTPNGSTGNTRIMVYSEVFNFESIDRPLSLAQGLLPYYDATLARTRLLAFSQTTLVEHAAPGATTESNGSRPSMTLSGTELSFGVPGANTGRGFFMTDVDASGTATVAMVNSTGNRQGTQTYTPVSLAASNVGDTKVGKETRPGQGAATLTSLPSITVQALGGTRLYWFYIEASQSPDSFSR